MVTQSCPTLCNPINCSPPGSSVHGILDVFIHRVAFEEVSGHRVPMKSVPGYRGRSAFGTTHVASLEFPHETGLILKCAAKVMKLFQAKQRNRPSCGDQEGSSGSDEVLLGTSVFPSSETGMSDNFWGRISLDRVATGKNKKKQTKKTNSCIYSCSVTSLVSHSATL